MQHSTKNCWARVAVKRQHARSPRFWAVRRAILRRSFSPEIWDQKQQYPREGCLTMSELLSAMKQSSPNEQLWERFSPPRKFISDYMLFDFTSLDMPCSYSWVFVISLTGLCFTDDETTKGGNRVREKRSKPELIQCIAVEVRKMLPITLKCWLSNHPETV